MNFLKGIFENETVKNMAFGTVKKTMKEQGARYMVVSLDDAGELDMQMHGAGVVIIPADQLAKAEQIMKEQEQHIIGYQQTIGALTDTIDDLTARIDKLTEENEVLYASGSAVPEQPAPGFFSIAATRTVEPKEAFEQLKQQANGDSSTTV